MVMGNMSLAVNRSLLAAEKDPNAVLSELLGPEFAAYRQAFNRAESGQRPSFPLHLDIDVTTACNFHCPMCPAGNTGHIFPGFRKGLFLDRRLYRKALAEAASFGLPSLRLGMTGEPLLVPDIAGWVREAKEAGVLDISLITNGHLLSPSLSRQLIEAGLTRLMISVDAGRPETYAKVRPGGDWDILIRNLRGFLDARDEIQSHLPLLRLSFVEMSVNQEDRDEFLKIFGPLADYLSFQRYLNILGAEDTDFSREAQPPPLTGFCSEPFTRLAIHADGGLFPCCADFGRLKPLGNLTTGRILATWRSGEAVLLTGPEAGTKDPCRACLSGRGPA